MLEMYQGNFPFNISGFMAVYMKNLDLSGIYFTVLAKRRTSPKGYSYLQMVFQLNSQKM